MLFRQLVYAAAASAFLIVPEISEADNDVVKTLPIEAESLSVPPHAYAQTVDLPCRQCRGRDAHLRMDFAVEDGSRLTLNGFELYPNADPWHGDLTAAVVKGNGKEKEQRLGYSLAVKPEGLDREQQMEVIGVEVRVLEVGGRFVNDLPTLKVKVVRAASNEILIGSLNVNEAPPSDCHSAWCRAKEMMDHAFKGVGGCASKWRNAHGRHGHHGPGHHRHGWGPSHHRNGHHHEWRRLFKNLASHIFLPILMGITAGFGVAILIMSICTLAVRLARFARGDQRQMTWRCVRFEEANHVERGSDDEKSGLMGSEDTEEPPQYEDGQVKL